MAEKPTEINPDECSNQTHKRAMGKPNVKRAKQARTKLGQVERTIQDLPRYRERDGKPMERIRIVFANELPECDCCGEPWCPVHLEHYSDCKCVGPCNAEEEGWELEETNGVLYGVKPAKP